MLEILLRVKEELENQIANRSKYTTFGLCGITRYQIGYGEYINLQKYMKEYIGRRKVFYDYKGKKTNDKSQFLWKPENYAARLKWLDKEINKPTK